MRDTQQAARARLHPEFSEDLDTIKNTRLCSGNFPIVNLRCALAIFDEHEDELVTRHGGSPFSKEIWAAPLPKGFQLPNIKTYDGKIDPQDHIDHLNDVMELHPVLNFCKVSDVCNDTL